MQTLKGHRGKIRSLSFSPDGSLLASCGGKGTAVSLWRLPKGKRSYLKGHRSPVWQVRFAPQGQVLLSCEEWGASALWSPDASGNWTPRTIHGSLVTVLAGGREFAYLD